MEFKEKDVVHSVSGVFFNIEAEVSATGFEIAVEGVLIIVKEKENAFIHWSPLELSIDDVKSLFSSGSEDAWTIIETPQARIDVSDLTVPEPILPEHTHTPDTSVLGSSPAADHNKRTPAASPEVTSCGHASTVDTLPSEGSTLKTMGSSKPSEVEESDFGVRSQKRSPPGRPSPPKSSGVAFHKSAASSKLPIHFPIENLESVREKSQTRRTVIVFYLSGKESTPPLYFQDGGAKAFIQCLQRFAFLVRSGTDLDLLVVEDSLRFERKDPIKAIATSGKYGKPGDINIISAVGTVVGEFSKVTKFVKTTILSSKQMPEQRPGALEEDEEEKELEAAAIVCRNPKQMSRIDPTSSLDEGFQLVDDVKALLPPLPTVCSRRPPLTREGWEMFRDFEGRISPENERSFRVHVFKGGLAPELRKEVWKCLLGFMSFGDTDLERMHKRQQKEEEYFCLKTQWQSMSKDQIANFSAYRDCAQLIHKDVVRTDREHSLYQDIDGPKLRQLEDILHCYLIYNVDLGYVQGMSDLLAPILAVMDNEIDAFWCFVGYMKMVCKYFEKTQQRTRERLKVLRLLLSVQEPELYEFLKGCGANNMFFAFRWLLINFKREFSYTDIMSLWETIWSGVLSPDYALFIALAILAKHKDDLCKEEDQSGIIRFINDLSMKLDVEEMLQLAEAYCLQLHLADYEFFPEEVKGLLVKGGKDELYSNLPHKAEVTSENLASR